MEYVADEEGFHVLPGSTPVEASLPEETPVVAAARKDKNALTQSLNLEKIPLHIGLCNSFWGTQCL